MRVFTGAATGKSWEDKVNFVDANNTLVGYDMGQDCCEQANWTIAEHPASATNDGSRDMHAADLEPYAFDTAAQPVQNSIDQSELDEGESIAFRLVAPDRPDLWLTLFNCHNGYYSHGFTLDVGGKRALEGHL